MNVSWLAEFETMALSDGGDTINSHVSCRLNPEIHSRPITPAAQAPSDELLEQLEQLDRIEKQMESLEAACRGRERRVPTLLLLCSGLLLVFVLIGANSARALQNTTAEQARASQNGAPGRDVPNNAGSGGTLVVRSLTIRKDNKSIVTVVGGSVFGGFSVNDAQGRVGVVAGVNVRNGVVQGATLASLNYRNGRRTTVSGVSDRDEAYVSIQGEKSLAWLGDSPAGGAVDVNNKEGQRRLSFEIAANSDARLVSFADKQAKSPFLLGVAADGVGGLILSDTQGQHQAVLGLNNDGGLLSMATRNDTKCLLCIESGEIASILKLWGRNDKAVCYLNEDNANNGGSLWLMGPDGQQRAGATARRESGEVWVALPTGEKRGMLTRDNALRGGLLGLYGIGGSARMLLGLTPEGIGDAEAKNANGTTQGRLLRR